MNDEQRILVALAYVLWPVALVLLIVEEMKEEDRSKEVRYHSFNALGFWIAVLLLSVLVSLFAFIPVFGMIVVALFAAVVIITAVLLASHAYKGRRVRVPYVTDFLKKNIKGF